MTNQTQQGATWPTFITGRFSVLALALLLSCFASQSFAHNWVYTDWSGSEEIANFAQSQAYQAMKAEAPTCFDTGKCTLNGPGQCSGSYPNDYCYKRDASPNVYHVFRPGSVSGNAPAPTCAAGVDGACTGTGGHFVGPCPSGQTRQADQSCATVQQCPEYHTGTPPNCLPPCVGGEHRNEQGICTFNPNCYQTSGPGFYFDINERQCITEPNVVGECTGSRKQYCTPTNDCIFENETCSNNPLDKVARDLLRSDWNPPNHDRVEQADSTVDQYKLAAQQAVSNFQDIADQAQADYDDAQEAYQNNPTPETLNNMIEAANNLAAAQNDLAGATASSQAIGNKSNKINEIDENFDEEETMPGIGENYAENAEEEAEEAFDDLDDALDGDYPCEEFFDWTICYEEDGPTDGDPDGDGGTSGGSTDEGSDVNEGDISNGHGPKFGETDTVGETGEKWVDALEKWEPIKGINEIREMDFSASGECPTLEIDTTEDFFGVLSTDFHCELIAEHYTMIQNFARLGWVIGAVFLFLMM
ncbi:hypothetical protein [Methylomonas sp. DH-1]|uniref:hypothetical protein n=1 Tax=Methylomonas sp. (strain DH-1) TaxID=1727196 RepID=UPI0012F66B3C|nr:hypothetical protein [Methylomonas sp. DH-1]